MNKVRIYLKESGRLTGGHPSRGHAIVDGLLVNVTRQLLDLGFPLSGAMSFAAWHQGVYLPLEANIFQDDPERLLDALNQVSLDSRFTRWAEKPFYLTVSHRRGIHEKIHFKAVCHPGDDNEPVVTILLSGEKTDWI